MEQLRSVHNMVKDMHMVKYVQMVYWAAYEERLINDCEMHLFVICDVPLEAG